MTSQYRPAGSTGPMYSPERDLAYLGPTVLLAGIESLDQTRLSKEMESFLLNDLGLTHGEIAAAISAYAESQRYFIGVPDVITTSQALQAGGFTRLPLTAQQVVLAAIGGAVTGAWFKAVRDTTKVGELPHSMDEMFRFYQAAKQVAGDWDGTERPAILPPSVIELEKAKLAWAELRNRHSEVLSTLGELRTIYASTQNNLDEKIRELVRVRAELMQAQEKLNEKPSWWTHLRRAWSALWNREELPYT